MIYQFLLVLALSSAAAAQKVARQSPPFNYAFQNPLFIPSPKLPLATYTGPNGPIDFYEVKITPFSKNFFPNLGDAKMVCLPLSCCSCGCLFERLDTTEPFPGRSSRWREAEKL